MKKYSKLFYGAFLFVLISPLFYFIISQSHIFPADAYWNKDSLSNTEACQNFSRSNPVIKTFKYVLDGKEGEINLTMYPDLEKCLHKFPKDTSWPKAKHAFAEDHDDKDMMDNTAQETYLNDLAQNIKDVTQDKNDQARIAISLVQGFTYDTKHPDDYDFPYVTAYKEKGICNETAKLTVMILRDLGFGTAMLTFEDDNHQAAGIKCASQYAFQNSGYCFIETTSRAIITDPVGENTKGRVNPISDGLTFDAKKDYEDAQKYISLSDKKKETGPNDKIAYKNLEKEYGLGKDNA